MAGLLLGGGNTFTVQKGVACDDVVEYDVVPPGGRIMNASAESNQDFFRVLKGIQ